MSILYPDCFILVSSRRSKARFLQPALAHTQLEEATREGKMHISHFRKLNVSVHLNQFKIFIVSKYVTYVIVTYNKQRLSRIVRRQIIKFFCQELVLIPDSQVNFLAIIHRLLQSVNKPYLLLQHSKLPGSHSTHRFLSIICCLLSLAVQQGIK